MLTLRMELTTLHKPDLCPNLHRDPDTDPDPDAGPNPDPHFTLTLKLTLTRTQNPENWTQSTNPAAGSGRRCSTATRSAAR